MEGRSSWNRGLLLFFTATAGYMCTTTIVQMHRWVWVNFQPLDSYFGIPGRIGVELVQHLALTIDGGSRLFLKMLFNSSGKKNIPFTINPIEVAPTKRHGFQDQDNTAVTFIFAVSVTSYHIIPVFFSLWGGYFVIIDSSVLEITCTQDKMYWQTIHMSMSVLLDNSRNDIKFRDSSYLYPINLCFNVTIRLSWFCSDPKAVPT